MARSDRLRFFFIQFVAGACSTSVAYADDAPAPTEGELLLATEEGKPASLDPLPPVTLPPLTPAFASLELDYTGAGIGEEVGRALTWMSYVRAEVPLTTRAWHAGLAWDIVSAAQEGRGRALIYGNPEIWIRGVGWHESGLSAGGGLGLIIPVPRDLDEDGAAVLDIIRVIRPWDSGYFESNIVTLRPSFDARLVLDPFILQVRQGLDWSYAFGESAAPAIAPWEEHIQPDVARFIRGTDLGHAEILARWGTYVGLEPLPWVAVGLEAWQTYAVTKSIPDDKRAAFTLSPGLRLRLRGVEPGISVLFPIATPLEGIASDYFAVRLHVRLALGRTAAITY